MDHYGDCTPSLDKVDRGKIMDEEVKTQKLHSPKIRWNIRRDAEKRVEESIMV